MPLLTHSAADVLRSLLVQMSLATMPTSDSAWPAHLDLEPDSPDNCITLTDTSSRKVGREMIGGQVSEYLGVQVRVRARDRDTGYAKAKAIEVALDESVNQTWVSVDDEAYVVGCVMRESGILSLGKDVGRTARRLWTLNVTVDLKQLD